MKTWQGIVLAMVISTLCASSARAEWYTYTMADGLADNRVNSILEDRSGNLWFGTVGGVSRYDGLSWRKFTTANGLVHNSVYSILEDRSGNLWFGTWGGVSRYDGVSWRNFTVADGLANNSVTSILEDQSGNLWFGTWGGGASRYDGLSWHTFTTADGLARDYLNSILEDRSGNLWFGTGGGASLYDGVSWRTFTKADGLASNPVISILEDRSGNLWFGTNGGVSRYDGVGWRTFTRADGLVDNYVGSILEDRSGNLWFGTTGGVSRFDGVNWRTFTRADELADDWVKAILEDGSGGLWFGTQVGASRYDGVYWRTFTTADGLADNWVSPIFEDGSGNLWFGTEGSGVSWYDGTRWGTLTTEDGLADNWVNAILEDRSGNIWFGTAGGPSRYDGTYLDSFSQLRNEQVVSILEDRSGNLWFGTLGSGVTRYDGVGWRGFTSADGLGDNVVRDIAEDQAGNLWFGTAGGATRYDGVSWRTFTTADGLANNYVFSILADRSGNIWFGTNGGGISRYDGVSWRTFTAADGLAYDIVISLIEDRLGGIWSVHSMGVTRFDGVSWRAFTTADGLVDNYVKSIFEDRSGSLWFGTPNGATKLEPDRVPPRTVFLSPPLPLSASTTQVIAFTAAFRDLWGVTFSWSFDGSTGTDWSPTSLWVATGIPDGTHVLEVRARDKMGNVESAPAACVFEIDATPPMPMISSPTYSQPVRDSISILGVAADSRFGGYRLDCRRVGAETWQLVAESSVPIDDGVLSGWNTVPLLDGSYDLRLSVSDTLGLTGSTLTKVIVDNHTPWARETAPAVVKTAAGGNIYTTDEEVHLYFPPHAFDQDTEVDIAALADADVPDTLPDGAHLVLAGYEISWGGAALEKAATLAISYAGWDAEADESLALYVLGADSTWSRLGGTVDFSAERISTPISEAGRYAIYAEAGGVSGRSTLSDLVVTPRVFSPGGAFASDEAAISFTLGRPGPVTVKVYNRAGRLVREVVAGQQMNAGANLVRWDGRDGDAGVVPAGLYLITIEALGETKSKMVSIVR